MKTPMDNEELQSELMIEKKGVSEPTPISQLTITLH